MMSVIFVLSGKIFQFIYVVTNRENNESLITWSQGSVSLVSYDKNIFLSQERNNRLQQSCSQASEWLTQCESREAAYSNSA